MLSHSRAVTSHFRIMTHNHKLNTLQKHHHLVRYMQHDYAARHNVQLLYYIIIITEQKSVCESCGFRLVKLQHIFIACYHQIGGSVIYMYMYVDTQSYTYIRVIAYSRQQSTDCRLIIWTDWQQLVLVRFNWSWCPRQFVHWITGNLLSRLHQLWIRLSIKHSFLALKELRLFLYVSCF